MSTLIFFICFLVASADCQAEAPLAMQLFLKEPTAGLTAAPALGKFEPAYGAILGATVDKDPRLSGTDNVKDVYGRNYSAVLAYARSGEQIPDVILSFAKSNNLALQVSWEPSAGLEAIQEDSVQAMAAVLRDFGGPVFLRFGGEMNGDWVAWGQQPDLYVSKFRLVSSIMKQTAPNVAMVWSPNFVPDQDLDRYYPGDEYVDWVGINGYADYYFVGNPQNDSLKWVQQNFHQGRHANPLLKFQKIYEEYAARKPVMISETGVAWANRNPYLDVSDWGANTLERLYGYLPLMYPRIKAIFYFNTSVPKDFSFYSAADNNTMFEAYKAAISSPYYLEQYNGAAPFRYRPLDALPSEVCDLATNINDEEGQVAAVEYYLDGRFIARTTSIPWEATCRFPSKGGQSTLEARALDAQGNVISRTSQEIYVPAWQSINVTLDGKSVSLDTAPAIFDGRILAPIRALSELLGVQVSWDASARTVQLNGSGKKISIQVGSQQFYVNGSPVQVPDAGAKLVDGRVMVPLRLLSESFGLKVDWSNDGTVVLSH